jgi:hypothetical protein
MSVAAEYVDNLDAFTARKRPGSLFVHGGRMKFYCPCGCGYCGEICVGINHKPARTDDDRHTWNWHGWLTDGVWSA